jgi:cell division protein FtsL
MKKRVLLYFFTLTIPLFLGVLTWQSSRYMDLKEEVRQLEAEQTEWIDSNKRLIAGIAMLSSPERIEYIAKNDLGLVKKRPEEILQIRIEGRKGLDG